MKDIEKLLRQQAVIAEFGSFAFGEKELSKILDRACRLCAELFDVEFSKICEYKKLRKSLKLSRVMVGAMGLLATPTPQRIEHRHRYSRLKAKSRLSFPTKL